VNLNPTRAVFPNGSQRKGQVWKSPCLPIFRFADPENTHGEAAATVRAILYRYELGAIGVSSGNLDRKSYKK
jgi:hypothetical protein